MRQGKKRRIGAMPPRGQTAIEFIILLGFMLFVFTTFFYVIHERSSIIVAQNNHLELQTISDILLQEITIASRVKDGYTRTFEIPFTLKNGNYTVMLSNSSEITVTTIDEEYLVFLPVAVSIDTGAGTQASGRIYPGTIIIAKRNNNITLKSFPS
jgi:hypothetical protein